MPNNVSYRIEFRQINDAAKAKWAEMRSRLKEADDNGMGQWLYDLWVDGEEGSPTYDEVRQYSWTREIVGPKWAYAEKYDEYGVHGGVSAWSAPEAAVQWILEQLAELDPQMITVFSYEDEMPNFIGAYIYEGADLIDGFENDREEIRESMFTAYPSLKDAWDEEHGKWKDRLIPDEWYDNIWENCSGAQQDAIHPTIEGIKKNQARARSARGR